jgi:hypothetical protein
MRTADPLAGVVPGRALLRRAVGLDVGRVQVDGRAGGGKLGPLLLGQEGEPPVHEERVRLLDAGEDRVAEALRPPDERRRGGDPGHRPQQGAGQIATLVVEVGHEVAAGEHRLGHREHELSAGQPALTSARLADRAVERGGHPEDAVNLGDEAKAGTRRQRSVCSTKRDTGAGAAYRSHLTGVLFSGSMAF